MPAQLKHTKPSLSGIPPPVRGGHTAVLADLNLVVFGGHAYQGEGVFEYLDDVWCLDVGGLSWQRVYCGGVAPSKRYGHSCALVGSRMFIFGGRGPNGTLYRDMHFLDLQSWTWVPVHATSSGPTPRFYSGSCVVGRKIVVHGGWNGESKCYGDMWVFDTDTFTWVQPKTGGLNPPEIYGHSVQLGTNGHIMIFGGVNISGTGIPEYVRRERARTFESASGATRPVVASPVRNTRRGATTRHVQMFIALRILLAVALRTVFVLKSNA